jgi:DNA-binding response OmpR family regulator
MLGSKGKILVVDDEPRILQILTAYLKREGYSVVTAGDGQKALELFRRERPDLIILDLMLPELDGLEVCRIIRREAATPIIMLTARDEEADKLIGLELGADDYVTKPFSPREVVARVKAVLRRASAPKEEGYLRVGGLVLDSLKHQALCHGKPLPLTPTEFRILEALARHPGRVYTRAQLLELALGESFEGYERTVDSHIKNLRRKLEEAGGGEGCRIVTVFGVGYRLEEAQG